MQADAVKEQLGLLRELTKTTGVLHEAQVQQIRYWPVLLFEAKSAAEISTQTNTIHYKIMPTKTKKKIKWDKPSSLLAEWTKALLGEDWTVLVQVGKGKPKVFAGKTW